MSMGGGWNWLRIVASGGQRWTFGFCYDSVWKETAERIRHTA